MGYTFVNVEQKYGLDLESLENMNICLHAVIPKMNPLVLSTLFAGFPEDGHEEERGTAEASKREIRHQHRPSKVAVIHLHAFHRHIQSLFFFSLSVQTSQVSWFYAGVTDTVVENIL